MTQPFNAPPPWATGQPPAAPQAQPPWQQPAQPPAAPPWQPPTQAAPQAPAWAPPAAAPPAWAPPPGSAGFGLGAPPAGPPPGAYGPPGLGGIGNPLGGIGDAQQFTKTPFFPTGDFLVKIEELKLIESKNPKNLGHIMIIVECSVLQTNVPGVAPGNRYAQVIDLGKFGKADAQALLTALHGGNPMDASHVAHFAAQGLYEPAAVIHFTGPAQPMRNKKLNLKTAPKPTRAGGTFTQHFWMPATQ